ncbi:hypothetical protein FACS1894142_1650 [Spirochaetia bacterium]|nr:hypothetical protein FACS1894142_1650 [Spirochaetia bacterium]
MEKFVNDGYCVLNIDHKQPRKRNHTEYFVNIDITDFDVLCECITKFNPDYIIHLAARTDLSGKALDDYSANTVGVKNILEVSKNVPDLKKIIIASSMLVCSLGYKPKDQFDYHPTTIYGKIAVVIKILIPEVKY